MKKLTKIDSLVLALVMVFALTACGGSNNESKNAGANWPEQPVNVVVPASAGGGLDNMVRLLNEYFVKEIGIPRIRFLSCQMIFSSTIKSFNLSILAMWHLHTFT